MAKIKKKMHLVIVDWAMFGCQNLFNLVSKSQKNYIEY